MKFNRTTHLLSGAAIAAAALLMPMTSNAKKSAGSDNPFLAPYTNTYEIPPFDRIRTEHYLPALKEGISRHNAEIEAIATQKAAPTFDNTILALDQSGDILNKVSYVFFALSESNNDAAMQAIAKEAYPLLSAHSDEMMMNDALFGRVKTLYDNKASLGLNTAQERLLDKYYKDFVRSGALLNVAQKEQLKELNQELSTLELKFTENILEETNQWTLVVDNEADLAGLPQSSIGVAAEEAAERGLTGKWVFTLHAPSRLPLLTYADNRSLRQRMYEGYTSLASGDNAWNNNAVINQILRLRYRKARLLGFDSFAAYQLDNVMAKTLANAEELLLQLWRPAIAKVKEEVADMQALADARGDHITIEPWDYYYYAEKVKKQKFDISEDEVRPYFELEHVKKGIFLMANKLYGLTFVEMPKAPKYDPDVTVYDVRDRDGKHLAVWMCDYFPRAGKVQGAWMSEFKGSSNVNGHSERPIIFNVGNFTKPTKEQPSLLTIDEVETMFHESGHAPHGMLTTATYPGQAGTNVDRDLVEMPSQICEHWAFQPELLKEYAHHYITGEPIPDALIEKLNQADKFNAGFNTTELVGAALLDLEWHKVVPTHDIDVVSFEDGVAATLSKPAEVQFRYRSPYFKHIFGSAQYAAGYYTYLWSEVLDADAFGLFQERGVFDPATAASFRHNLLEPGDSEDPMVLFERFRGHKPQVDALLRMRGLK